MVLETSRLSLRCLTDGDYADLCRVMLQDPEVMYAYAHAFSGNGFTASTPVTGKMASDCGLWSFGKRGS